MGSKSIGFCAALLFLCAACTSGGSTEIQVRDTTDNESPGEDLIAPDAGEDEMPTEVLEGSNGEDGDEPGGLTFEEHRAGTPPSPENMTASPTDEGIEVTWEAATTGGVKYVYGDIPLYYKVFRRMGDELDYTQIGTTTETFFLDEDVEMGQVYYYTVVQVHGLEDGGEIDGDRPDEVSATAP